jgi:glycosyltransferase involved in cell wall biosynthesis
VARILWHGIGPWHHTGYGVLTSLFAPRLRDLGHDVVIAVMGEQQPAGRNPLSHPGAAETRRTGLWQGMPVIGPGHTEFALPFTADIKEAFGGHSPDLVLVLKDAWVLRPHAYQQHNTAVWLFFDTDQLGVPDRQFFAESHARAVCVSLHGQAAIRAAGLSGVLHVPAGIDTGFWAPGPRDDARDLLGLPRDVFIAGIDAANIGPRKGWGEQLAAFARFRAEHPRSLLLLHTTPEHPEGISLRDLAANLGITDAVAFGAHSNMKPEQMLSWYRSLNVLLQGSYGEGFGLPVTQAQACGVPVIGTDCSAISEKILPGTGWLVRGQKWWNPHHQAWWTIPNVQGLYGALRKAARGAHARPELIRQHALAWDADTVIREYWKPVLDELLEDA